MAMVMMAMMIRDGEQDKQQDICWEHQMLRHNAQVLHDVPVSSFISLCLVPFCLDSVAT